MKDEQGHKDSEILVTVKSNSGELKEDEKKMASSERQLTEVENRMKHHKSSCGDIEQHTKSASSGAI